MAESALTQASTRETALDEALVYAERAARFSLWDYKSHQFLGVVQEMKGDLAGAERSLRKSANLAGNYADANWALGNLLLREGKIGEAIPPLRKAASASEDLFPLTYDLLWRFANGDLSPLRELARNNPSAELSLVQFLLDQSMIDQALSTFRSIDRQARVASPKSPGIIRTLIGAGRLVEARALWLELVTDRATESAIVWNGGFEENSVKLFNHFDWTLAPSPYARIGIDSTQAHTGGRSLKITFAGRDTTTLKDEIKQLIWLRPGARYRLEFYVLTKDLLSPEGPRVAIFNETNAVALSAPVPEGTTNDWQRIALEFIAPTNQKPNFLAIVRLPKFSYDDPTRGAVWFDDFHLTEL